jgi:hypothetical protein
MELLLAGIVIILVQVALIRWVFKINTVIQILKEIRDDQKSPN